jgi:enoyl-CoA hydratase/carnithine racemase
MIGKTEKVEKRESDKGTDALVKKMGEMSLRKAEVRKMVIAQDILVAFTGGAGLLLGCQGVFMS